MSDGSISQDEIDALLSGVGMGSGPKASNGGTKGFSPFKQEALTNFVNGNIPGLSSNLESMTGMSLNISEPSIEFTEREGFLKQVSEMVVASLIDFSGAITGDHVFVISPEFAKKIVSLVNHEDNTEIDDMALSVISETMAQYVATEITSLETAGLSNLSSNPAESLHVPKAMLRLPQGHFVSICYNIQLDNASYKLWEVLPEASVDTIVEAVAGPDLSAQNANAMPMGAGMQQNATPMYGMQQNMGQPMQAQPMPQGMGGQYIPQGGQQGMQMNMQGMPQMGMNTNVQSVQFPPLQGFVSQEEQGNIGLIMDVYMEMTVELGRTKKIIKEILGMGEGHIIELDKLAGEPVDVLINHKPIAKGEVVVIEENFGVRITEILSPAERIKDI